LLDGLGTAVALSEALHSTRRIHQLLLPRVIGVAGGADIDVNVRRAGARLEGGSAGAAHLRALVRRMYPFLHTKSLRIVDRHAFGPSWTTQTLDRKEIRLGNIMIRPARVQTPDQGAT